MVIYKYLDKSIISIIFGLIILGLMMPVQGDVQSIDVPSYVIDPVRITAQLGSDGTTLINIQARIINIGPDPISSVDIRIDSLDISMINATVDGMNTDSFLSVMEKHTMITITSQNKLEVNSSSWISIELVSYDLQSSIETVNEGDYQSASLVFYMKPHTSISNFTFVAILPDHAILMQESVIPLFPKAGSNFTDGTNMGFVWFVDELYPGQERVFIVRYQVLDVSESSAQIDILTAGILMTIGAAIGVAVMNSVPNIISKVRLQGSVNYVGLTNEERSILESIEKHGGSYSQKELYRQLSISESKLSLILSGLEEREIIKRVRKGRQNIIYVIK